MSIGAFRRRGVGLIAGAEIQRRRRRQLDCCRPLRWRSGSIVVVVVHVGLDIVAVGQQTGVVGRVLGQRFQRTGRFQKVAAWTEILVRFVGALKDMYRDGVTYRLRSYFSIINSRCSCVCTRFGSQRPSHVLAHSSLPCALINSISSLVNVAIDIDLTRCGGVMPRLAKKRMHHRFFCFKSSYIICFAKLYSRSH